MKPKFTPSQEFGRLLVEKKILSNHPFMATKPIDLEYGFAGFEFWYDSHELLYVAVCIPDDSHVVNGLLALLDHFENKLMYEKEDELIRWASAVIMPFGYKTKFPPDVTVFVAPPELGLLLALSRDGKGE